MTLGALERDDHLLARLRSMWQSRDPMPDHLVESVLVALATRDLGSEYEQFILQDSSDRLAGVRGASDSKTLHFSVGTSTMMLRVSRIAEGRRRIDGWLAPASPHGVLLSAANEEHITTVSEKGRFEFASVSAGTATIWLDPTTLDPITADPKAPAKSQRLATPPFDL